MLIFFLDIWLVEIPEHTESFFIFMLVYAFVDVLSYPLDIAAQATGKLRKYSLLVSISILLNLLFSYFAFMNGYEPEFLYIVALFMTTIGLFIRLLQLKYLINLNVLKFATSVIFKILIVVVISCLIPLSLSYFYSSFSISYVVFSILFSFFISLISIYCIGLSIKEKNMVKRFCITIKNKLMGYKLS